MLSYKPIFFYTLKDSYEKHVEIFPYVDYLVGTDAKDVSKNEFVIYPQSRVTTTTDETIFGIFNQQKIGEKPIPERTWDHDLYVSNENMKTAALNCPPQQVANTSTDTIKRALFCFNYDQLDNINDSKCDLSDPKKAKVVRLDKRQQQQEPHVDMASPAVEDRFNPKVLLKRLNDFERNAYRQKHEQQQQQQTLVPAADSYPELENIYGGGGGEPQPTDDQIYEYLLTQDINGILKLNEEWLNEKYDRTGLLTIAPTSYLLILHTIKDDFFGNVSDQTFKLVSTLRKINAKGESYSDEALMSEFALSLISPYIQKYTYKNFDINVFKLSEEQMEYIEKNLEQIQEKYLKLLKTTILMNKANNHYPYGTQATYALCTSDLYIQTKPAQRGYFIIKLNHEQMTYTALEIYSGLLDQQNRSTQILELDQSLPKKVFDLDSVGPNAKWRLEHVEYIDINKVRDLMVLELSANWLGIND